MFYAINIYALLFPPRHRFENTFFTLSIVHIPIEIAAPY